MRVAEEAGNQRKGIKLLFRCRGRRMTSHSLKPRTRFCQLLIRKSTLNHCVVSLMFAVICTPIHAAQTFAFNLEGEFEWTLEGKHVDSGRFSIAACQSNALIELIFGSGYREMSGTDGRDTFTYVPFTRSASLPPMLAERLRAIAASGRLPTNAFPRGFEQSRPVTNAIGRAAISFGRFPTNAHPFAQLLWLVSVRDAELAANLPSLHFPFFANYRVGQVTPTVVSSESPPHLVTSIEWYAPNTMNLGNKSYELAVYPAGWLLAELTATHEVVTGNVSLPVKITFTREKQRGDITNSSQFAKLHVRDPKDVLPLEVVSFIATNSQLGKPLPNYIPQVPDSTAIVADKRIGHTVQVASGKWWASKELVERRFARNKLYRIIVIASFAALLAIPVALLAKHLGQKRTTAQ